MAESGSTPHVYTISQFSNAIKLCLEGTFPSVWLQGEVSNCKLHTSGHLYFTLKDSQAQISAVMYRAEASGLKAIPKEGDNLIVRGDINVYPPSGKYQINVRELRQVGVGELLQRLEELKIKLHKKGWFRPEHKKPIPKLPKKIGVVTSPTGAAIQDILNVLTRRFSGFELILNPVKVQGEGSAQEIAQAIRQFNEYGLVDVMIVGRGGGSIEDLWAFNEEIVAEAIFESRIPIISAVGHETDHCIADYVADLRAPTPSAAAEIVISEKAHLLQHLEQTSRRMRQTLLHLVRQDKQRLEGIKRQPLMMSPYALLGPAMQRLDDMRVELDQAMLQLLTRNKILLEGRSKQAESLKPTAQIAHFKQKLLSWDKAIRFASQQLTYSLKKSLGDKIESLTQTWNSKQDIRRKQFNAPAFKKQLDLLWQRSIQQKRERLTSLATILSSVDPKNVLTKGYCIVFSEKDGSVITSVQSLQKDQEIRMVLSDGEVISTVKEIINK